MTCALQVLDEMPETALLANLASIRRLAVIQLFLCVTYVPVNRCYPCSLTGLVYTCNLSGRLIVLYLVFYHTVLHPSTACEVFSSSTDKGPKRTAAHVHESHGSNVVISTSVIKFTVSTSSFSMHVHKHALVFICDAI